MRHEYRSLLTMVNRILTVNFYSVLSRKRTQLEQDYDILHTHHRYSGHAVNVLELHVPWVHTPHLTVKAIMDFLEHDGVPDEITQKLKFDLLDEIYIFRDADQIIAVSNHEKKLILSETYRSIESIVNKVTVIPNGINPEEYKGGTKSIAGKTRFTILCVGRITRQKGIAYLVEAIGILRSRGIGVSANVIGLAQEEDVYAELIRLRSESGFADAVTFTGTDSVFGPDEIRREYEQADVYVQPSLEESFGMAVLEALASGCPVVASAVGAIPELLEGGVGVVVSPRNAEAIANGVEYIVGNPERYKDMSEKGIERSRRYSWGSIAHVTANLYERVIAERGERQP